MTIRIVNALSVAAFSVAEAKRRLMAGIPVDEFPDTTEEQALELVWDAWYRHALKRELVGEVREWRPPQRQSDDDLPW